MANFDPEFIKWATARMRPYTLTGALEDLQRQLHRRFRQKKRGPKAAPAQIWLEEQAKTLGDYCRLIDVSDPFSLTGKAIAEALCYSSKRDGRTLHQALNDRGYRIVHLQSRAWSLLGCPQPRENS